jgi:hypothetical protein
VPSGMVTSAAVMAAMAKKMRIDFVFISVAP